MLAVSCNGLKAVRGPAPSGVSADVPEGGQRVAFGAGSKRVSFGDVETRICDPDVSVDKRKRHSRSDDSLWRLALFNSSGRSQAVDVADGVKDGRLCCELFFLQEHWSVRDLECGKFQDSYARRGIKVSLTPGVCGPKGGNSCGTAIGATSGQAPLRQVPGISFDCSPAEAGGRITCCFVQSRRTVGGGYYAISAYLIEDQPLTSYANMAIIRRLAYVVKDLRSSWVLAADFNCTSDNLESWANEVGGNICTPDTFSLASGVTNVFFTFWADR